MKPAGLKERIYAVKGSYILMIELFEAQTVTAGRLGAIDFTPGHYAYAGSAMNGLYPRIKRHLRAEKKLRWHIDYLLQKARVKDIIICEAEDKIECFIARTLQRQYESVPGFGCSDCKCSSHLFFAPREMGPDVMKLLDSLDMSPVLKAADSIRE